MDFLKGFFGIWRNFLVIAGQSPSDRTLFAAGPELTDEQILKCLETCDSEFSGDDLDSDPLYEVPKRSSSLSSNSESDLSEQNVSCPSTSSSSFLSQSNQIRRSRGFGRGRGTRGPIRCLLTTCEERPVKQFQAIETDLSEVDKHDLSTDPQYLSCAIKNGTCPEELSKKIQEN
ncbi:unnamed protein product [Psylliodes chrysocephalus]|uniref:Uncharacterized protein n=1 Tax=Psylliodes chrysocephalus TaxID=3402493 RepID=A0A9P0CH73_9CUCU|nr:unnamed protein product [Psylliodes chrysocephala]